MGLAACLWIWIATCFALRAWRIDVQAPYADEYTSLQEFFQLQSTVYLSISLASGIPEALYTAIWQPALPY